MDGKHSLPSLTAQVGTHVPGVEPGAEHAPSVFSLLSCEMGE